MLTKPVLFSLAAAGVAGAAAIFFLSDGANGQNGMRTNPALDLSVADTFDVPPADAKTTQIVAAAGAFLATLTEAQREAALFPFDDTLQRTNWSNFPHPVYPRAGVMRVDMSEAQLAALDALLAEVMSETGYRNIVWQRMADEASDTGGGGPLFGEEYYFVSFLGEPATDSPWMLQFGGHHLAINATVFGPDISFSPMLTGGEPLKLTVEGEAVWITEDEVMAADALMAALDPAQREIVVRSDRAINLVVGPGQDDVTLPAEGLLATEMTDAQRELLLALIESRLGFINDDDFAAKMEIVRAELDQTTFGWWGPTDQPGAAYFRITGPSLLIEYSPQAGDGDPTDHAHNMYRNPANDYGAGWISE